MSIDLNKITPRQKLTIAKGLCDYQYIMENWYKNDEDFQKVYYEFYLKSRWSEINKGDNKKIYFNLLKSISPDTCLVSIVTALKKGMNSCSNEFSIASKLLHTRNPSLPIYDSKIREYLSKKENVNLWWQIPNKVSGAPRCTKELDKIEHDWYLLCKWYEEFESEQWISWFDSSFPAFKDIANVKKIDFIIFAAN